jgi:hypothetical protein
MEDDIHYLDEPLLEDVLKAPYFFNGRLLTQEDLTQEQAAQRARRKHLGRSLGSGVAYGLEVEEDRSLSGPDRVVLAVAAGLAIAPDGDTLHLPELALLEFSPRPRAASQNQGSSLGDFGDCPTSPTIVSVAKTGLHLLVIRPTAGRQGLASVSGLGNEAAPCNTKYRTSGVSFRALPLENTVDATGTTPERFRSTVARKCFGFFDDSLAAALADPFIRPSPLKLAVPLAPGAAPAAGLGLIDRLRLNRELCDCELPLAIVNLRDEGTLDFVDVWPVRRPLLRPPLSRRFWPFGGSDDRRRADSEAAMLCFQDHVLALDAKLKGKPAKVHFAFLPGGGFLPFTATSDARTFLGASASRVCDMDFGRLRWLVEESWRCEAVDLDAPPMPPITYFVFPGKMSWMFFLRGRTGVEADLRSTEPVSGETKRSGKLLAVVTAEWIRANGEPKTLQLHDGEREEVLVEIEDEAAKRAALVDAGLLRSEGLRPGKKGEDVYATRYAKARMFVAPELSPGKYRIVAITQEGKKPFSEVVNVSAGSVLVVPVS